MTGTVHPGRPHVFPLPLQEGTYFEFHLDRPANRLRFRVSAPHITGDPETEELVSGEPCPPPCEQMVWEIASTTAEHLLRIETRADEPVPYRLTVAALNPATARDRSRHRGMEVYNDGVRLKALGLMDDALDHFLDARKLFDVGGYVRGVAATYSLRGGILQDLHRWRDAREELEAAADAWRRGGDPSSVAGTLVRLGAIERELGNWERSKKILDEALASAQELDAPAVQANALVQTCRLHIDIGRSDLAIENCNEAIEIKSRIGRIGETVEPLIGLATVFRYKGELDRARAYLTRARKILGEFPDRRLEANVQNDLAILLDLDGNYLEALASYQEALRTYESLGITSHAATVLSNMGTIHQRLGDLDTALEYYRQARAQMEATGEVLGRILILQNIGWVHIQNRDLDQAEEVLDEAIRLARNASSTPLLAASLVRMGELHLASNRPQEAIASLSGALDLYRASESRWREPWILIQLSRAHAVLDDLDRAQELLFDAAAIYEDIGWRSNLADSYSRIAQLARRRGDLLGARRAIEQAIAASESLRTRVGSVDLQTLISATTRPYSEIYVEILMELHRRHPQGGHDTEALRESERARARSLLDILSESGLDIGEDVPEALLAERESIQNRLNAAEIERQQLIESGETDKTDLFRMKFVLEGLLTELQELERRIRASSPRYAALTRPEPVTVGEIQRSLLDPETALLEFLLGEDRSFLWVVTATSFHSYELPGRQEIETGSRCVHWLITAYGDPPELDEVEGDNSRCLGPELAAYEATLGTADGFRARVRRRQAIEAAFSRQARKLSDMLLGPPARDRLLPFRLALVSDGALEYVPFAALPSPSANGDPLVVEHELVRLPSASVLAFQRNHPAPTSRPEGELAIVADPVYSLSDERLTQVARPVVLQRGTASNGRRQGSLPELSRLDFSGQEADAIVEFAAAPRTILLEGLDANRETVTGGALAGYRYVHFATHGLIDTEHPQLSSLVLSLVDRSGRPDEGGYLRLHDIYGLDLEDADMAVLSACETALGREVRGEGLVGLTRGFLYAGAERVVASLWQVQDRATADLMERLYRGLLEEDRSPADALRRAQLETREATGGEPRFPYYWAGFVLQGEWR